MNRVSEGRTCSGSATHCFKVCPARRYWKQVSRKTMRPMIRQVNRVSGGEKLLVKASPPSSRHGSRKSSSRGDAVPNTAVVGSCARPWLKRQENFVAM